MSKSSKGSSFERELCTKLSLWWTKDLPEPRDDIFWRTAGSGARAKTRGRKNKTTFGQDADITAIDPDGLPFTNLITIEAKRGYNKHTFADLIDKPKLNVKQIYEDFFDQVLESQKQAKSPYWMLIHKRDRRKTLCIIPNYLLYDLERQGTKDLDKYNRIELKIDFIASGVKVYILNLDDFLKEVNRNHINNLYKNWKNE